nr:Dps family protein [Nodosilinea sp. LEGE 07088]
MSINIGLSDQQRQGVVGILNQVLADAYLLLIKTKKYHWDVVGPQFRTLHELWKEQYEALTASIDAIAERVRMLNGYPLGTAAAFLKHTSLKEHPGDLPNACEMVRRLVMDHEQIICNLRTAVD